MSVALVVGHNSSRKGAINYLGEYEYDFNKRIALRVGELLDYEIDILYKNDLEKYENSLKGLTPHIAIELHFNFFGGNASGCEALTLEPLQDAKAFLYLLSKKFNLRNRGVKLLDPKARGYKNLVTLSKYCTKSFILEPCFQGDEAIFENEEKYALLIAEFLRDYLPLKEKKPYKQEESLWTKLFQFLSGLFRY